MVGWRDGGQHPRVPHLHETAGKKAVLVKMKGWANVWASHDDGGMKDSPCRCFPCMTLMDLAIYWWKNMDFGYNEGQGDFLGGSGVGTTYPDLLVPLDGNKGLGAEEVKGHHSRLVLVLPNISQEPEPGGMVRVTQGGHQIDAGGRGGAGGTVEGDKVGGGGQGAVSRLLHAGPDTILEATRLAEGAAGRSALHSARRPARAALAAVGGEDGLGDLQGGTAKKPTAFNRFSLAKIAEMGKTHCTQWVFPLQKLQKAKKRCVQPVSSLQRLQMCKEMLRAPDFPLARTAKEKHGRMQAVSPRKGCKKEKTLRATGVLQSCKRHATLQRSPRKGASSREVREGATLPSQGCKPPRRHPPQSSGRGTGTRRSPWGRTRPR